MRPQNSFASTPSGTCIWNPRYLLTISYLDSTLKQTDSSQEVLQKSQCLGPKTMTAGAAVGEPKNLEDQKTRLEKKLGRY